MSREGLPKGEAVPIKRNNTSPASCAGGRIRGAVEPGQASNRRELRDKSGGYAARAAPSHERALLGAGSQHENPSCARTDRETDSHRPKSKSTDSRPPLHRPEISGSEKPARLQGRTKTPPTRSTPRRRIRRVQYRIASTQFCIPTFPRHLNRYHSRGERASKAPFVSPSRNTLPGVPRFV